MSHLKFTCLKTNARPETTMPRRPREFASAREAINAGRSSRNRSPRRPAMLCGYCGPNNVLPRGYDYWETRYRCLQKGFGAGKFSERRKWQSETGQRVDPEFPSQCPRLTGNNRAPIRRNGRTGRRDHFRRRGSRSSRSSSRSSSSDDESSDYFNGKRSARAVRRTKTSTNRRAKTGPRSSRRRTPCC